VADLAVDAMATSVAGYPGDRIARGAAGKRYPALSGGWVGSDAVDDGA
jgi:hypothetical protein